MLLLLVVTGLEGREEPLGSVGATGVVVRLAAKASDHLLHIEGQ